MALKGSPLALGVRIGLALLRCRAEGLRHQGVQFGEDLVVLGEAPGLELAVNQFTVGLYVEYAARALDQLGLDAVLGLDRIRQTGGLREVVSFPAVLDADFHVLPPVS